MLLSLSSQFQAHHLHCCHYHNYLSSSYLILLLQSKINLSVLASLTSIAAARAAQVWSRAQLTRQQMQDAMTQGLYEKSADSQEGVLHTVLNQMSDQHTKEVILAYAVLLIRGTSDDLDS